MTNLEKLYKIFPHTMSSCTNVELICPAILQGYTICTNCKDIKDIADVYNMNDDKCKKCARAFWREQYKEK